MRTAIFGAGGLGTVVLDILLQNGGHQIAGFYDDHKTGSFLNYTVLGDRQDLVKYRTHNVEGIVIALGDGCASERIAVAQVCLDVGLKFVTAAHPRAVVSPSAVVDPGCILCAGAVVNPLAEVGANCVVFSGAVIEHNCRIGPNCYLSPGVITCGYVVIGPNSFLGAGSVVLPDITLGDNVTVGAGAMIRKDVPSGHVVMGVPGREVRVKDSLVYH